MTWYDFPQISLTCSLLWLVATVLFYFRNYRVANYLGHLLYLAGIGLLVYFIASFWSVLDRPPLRTLGETRLWYALFLPAIGYITYLRWQYRWFILYTSLLAILFLAINVMHPENHSKTLMPALQSYWFVPHVIVYIIGYAFLGVATLVALFGIIQVYRNKYQDITLKLADNLVYLGFAFITFGLLFGALWAKEAWGHYWTWDPKETWAFLTWMMYLIYIHFRYFQPRLVRTPLWILALAFGVLMIAWYGVNYLPSASNSVHTYSKAK